MKDRLIARAKPILDFLGKVMAEFNGDGAPRMAAAMAYYTIFSLAPLLVIVIAVIGLILGQQTAQTQLVGQLAAQVGQESAELVAALVAKAFSPASSIIALAIGVLGVLGGASTVVLELQAALNNIWDVKVPPAKGIKGFLLSIVQPWFLVLIVGAVMVGAVWLIYHVEARYWLGFSVALIAAFLAAVFAVINKQLVRRWHFSTIGTYQMSGAFVVTLAALPFFRPTSGALLTMPTAAQIGWLALLAFGCTVAAYAGYMDALRRLSVFQVNVIYNMEPVYGILLAAAIFGKRELMSPGFYLGAGIILMIVVSMPWLRRWQIRQDSL